MEGGKRFASFFNLSFYIFGGYITFLNDSDKEMVFFAHFPNLADHFIFNVWASHLT